MYKQPNLRFCDRPLKQGASMLSQYIRRLLLLSFCFCLLLGLGLSSGHMPTACAWQYEAITDVRPGQKASISIVAPTDLKQVLVTLSSDRSKRKIKKKIRSLSAHKGHKVSFKPPKGNSHWSVEVQGKTRDGSTETVVFELDILNAAPLKIQFYNQDSDLQSGRLVFSSTRPLDRVELEAYGDDGGFQWDDKLSLTPIAKNKLEAKFSPREETPRRLEIKAFDTTGAWMSFRVAHWYANVPRENVLFDSGSVSVASSEIPKLEKARDSINDEIARFRKAMGNPTEVVDLQLYVAGYTDTVGDQKDNLKLSAGRALAISKVFRQLGIRLPIRYAGFGEGALVVQTPDSTDESRNRRVDYIVANTAPNGMMFPNARWRTLK